MANNLHVIINIFMQKAKDADFCMSDFNHKSWLGTKFSAVCECVYIYDANEQQIGVISGINNEVVDILADKYALVSKINAKNYALSPKAVTYVKVCNFHHTFTIKSNT